MGKRYVHACRSCHWFRKEFAIDAYGGKYLLYRCANPDSTREKLRRELPACKRWKRKSQPFSGDFCYQIRKKIIYDENTPKTKLPCYTCNYRCVYSFNKKEKDFTTRRRGKDIKTLDEVE